MTVVVEYDMISLKKFGSMASQVLVIRAVGSLHTLTMRIVYQMDFLMN